MDGVCVVLVTNIDADRKALNANRRRPFELELQEADAEILAHFCHAGEQHYTWPEIVEQAARDTRLRAGDVLGSGTLTGGCLLELGPLDGNRFLEPGDTVAIEAQGLGRLETRIA